MTLRDASLLVAFGLGLAACEDPREWRSRQAVQQLVKATPSRVRAARERVRSVGAYALVDIEQELHGAELATRMRLINVMGEIGAAEALPLLRFLARWDEDALAREAAQQAARDLEARTGGRPSQLSR